MSFSMFLTTALVLVHSAVAVLEKGAYVPDDWSENLRAVQGQYMYVKDPQDCGFGYLCDQGGKVMDVYNCSKFNAFFSITFKICAVESVLKAHGEETCDFVPPPNQFVPQKDDPLCNEYPNQANTYPDNCAQFVLCWDNESLDIVDCQQGTGFDPQKQRCENLTPSTVDSVCSGRPLPDSWVKPEQ